MRLLVDTNVFLDLLLKRDTLSLYSRKFFSKASQNNDEIYLCSSSLKDIAYFVKKKTHENDLTNKILLDLYGHVTKIVGISSDDAISALYADGDYEDNCLCEVCKTSMCDAIITNNIKDFCKPNIVALNPQDYLEKR